MKTSDSFFGGIEIDFAATLCDKGRELFEGLVASPESNPGGIEYRCEEINMPDVGMAEFQMGRQQRIILACEKSWTTYSDDCSGFVRAVARELGITLSGNANELFNAIHHTPWSPIGLGDSAAHLAAVAATNGSFVVGAWKHPSGGNGHVAVIVDTNYSSRTAPHRTRAIAYWGVLDDEGEKYAKHSLSWNSQKRPQVFYAAQQISMP